MHREHGSGQVAVGAPLRPTQTFLLAGLPGGVLLDASPSETQVVTRPRRPPVIVRPRPLVGFLDREVEMATTVEAIEDLRSPIEVYGGEGVGKSTQLSRIAYREPTAVLPDGIVSLTAGSTPLPDILQVLFEAFFVTDVPLQLAPDRASGELQRIRALVLLDDAELDREELGALRGALPRSVLVLVGPTRRFSSEGQPVRLAELPTEHVLTFAERELARPLDDDERALLPLLWSGLEGNLHDLVWAVERVGEHGQSFVSLVRQPPSAWSSVARAAVLEELSEPQREVAALLAAVPVPLAGEHLTALAETANVPLAIEQLRARRIVQASGEGFCLIGHLGSALRRSHDLHPPRERALAYFMERCEGDRDAPQRLTDVVAPALWLLDWAVGERRFPEAIRLGTALDATVALSRRWGTWERLLHAVRIAATELGDRRARAWALHQLGTRALCLEQSQTAHAFLTEALHARLALGDDEAAELTRHNIGFLPETAPAVVPIVSVVAEEEEPTEDLPAVATSRGGWLRLLVVGVLVAAVAVSGAYALARSRPALLEPASTPSPLPSPSASPPPLALQPTTPSSPPTPPPTPPPPASPQPTSRPAPVRQRPAPAPVPDPPETATVTASPSPSEPAETASASPAASAAPSPSPQGPSGSGVPRPAGRRRRRSRPRWGSIPPRRSRRSS